MLNLEVPFIGDRRMNGSSVGDIRRGKRRIRSGDTPQRTSRRKCLQEGCIGGSLCVVAIAPDSLSRNRSLALRQSLKTSGQGAESRATRIDERVRHRRIARQIVRHYPGECIHEYADPAAQYRVFETCRRPRETEPWLPRDIGKRWQGLAKAAGDGLVIRYSRVMIQRCPRRRQACEAVITANRVGVMVAAQGKAE